MSTWVPIIVALIGGGGPVVALIMRLDRKNDKQHGENAVTLNRIEQKVDQVDDRLFKHIEQHDR
jgi:uncharacterized membrane-anchored protein YhcB (DUF1043 family)